MGEHLNGAVVTKQLCVRTPMIKNSEFLNQFYNVTSKSLGHSQFPLGHLMHIGGLAT